MKTLQSLVAAILLISFSHLSFSQSPSITTQVIKVSGVCGMCKSTIEKSSAVDGVKKASWDQEKQLLTLVFDPAKVTSDDIQKKIAASGYDTEKYRATDKAYNSLHSCCKYERKLHK